MPQNRETGRAANIFGTNCARQIALALNATPISTHSNEFLLNGRKVAIKCARRKTTSIGVTYAMLERVERIIGAFQIDEHAYELLSLDARQFKDNMSQSQSRGHSRGLVCLVSRLIFRKIGERVGHVHIELE